MPSRNILTGSRSLTTLEHSIRQLTGRYMAFRRGGEERARMMMEASHKMPAGDQPDLLSTLGSQGQFRQVVSTPALRTGAGTPADGAAPKTDNASGGWWEAQRRLEGGPR